MSEPPTYEDVRVEVEGPVARVVIDRPARLNALRMTRTDRELVDAFGWIERSDEIRAVILTGAGERAFCTGWDLEEVGDTTLMQLERLVRSNMDLFLKIWHLRQPVVAALNGYALGAGASMALVCDLAIAAESAKIGEPEIRHGALSPFPVLPFHTLVKPLHAFYYFGDMMDAETMLRLGLVNQVVPDGELETAAAAYAARLAKVPPDLLQTAKRSLRATYDAMGLQVAMRQHGIADTLAIAADTPDQRRLMDILARNGMRAFLEERDGPFRLP